MEPTTAAWAAGVDPARIHTVGRVSDLDLAALLASASALIVPSRAEGFGLPMVEAMAAGVPVVHSDAPALVEVAGGAGLVVPVGDVPALAEAARAASTDAALADRLRSAGTLRSAEFTWAAAAARTWDLHMDGVASGGGR